MERVAVKVQEKFIRLKDFNLTFNIERNRAEIIGREQAQDELFMNILKKC